MSKCLSYHLYIASLVDTNILAAHTLYPALFLFDLIHSCNPILMAPQNFTLTNLVIFPQLLFTGCTFND